MGLQRRHRPFPAPKNPEIDQMPRVFQSAHRGRIRHFRHFAPIAHLREDAAGYFAATGPPASRCGAPATESNGPTEWIVMVTKFSPALFALALAVGCDAPDPESAGSEPATVESPDALDESPEKSTQAPATPEDSWQDPTVEETEDGWATTWETPNVITEDPGCYYTEGLNTEVLAVQQVHAQAISDCSSGFPVPEDEADPGYDFLYYSYYKCLQTAEYSRSYDISRIVKDCFDEDTQWYHEDWCATYLATTAHNECLGGKLWTAGNWDICEPILDIRYDDAMASGECDVEV